MGPTVIQMAASLCHSLLQYIFTEILLEKIKMNWCMTFFNSTQKIMKLIFVLFSMLFVSNIESQCIPDDIINLKKTAIVFGEKEYLHSKVGVLKNTLNDADDIADSLRKIGFNVEVHKDANLRTMKLAIENWLEETKNFDVALFYFSGHGADVNKTNYLFPIDANPHGEQDMDYQTYSANYLIDKLSTSDLQYSIVLLDACRNNPFTKSWTRNSTSGGLGGMTGNKIFIGFASAIGSTASDGDGRNGVYTEAILKYITKPDLTIDEIFTKVNNDVRTKTNEKQVPYRTSSLNKNYCFSVNFRKPLSGIKKNKHYVQRCSNLTMSADEEELYIINERGELIIKDSRSLAVRNQSFGKLKAYKIIAGSDKVYVLDTVSRSLVLIDSKSKKVREIILGFKPVDFTVSQNEKRAYVVQVDSLNEYVRIVDIESGKIERDIVSTAHILKIAVSFDNNFIYVLERNDSVSFLKVFNQRSLIVVDSMASKSVFSDIVPLPNSRHFWLLNRQYNYTDLLLMNSKFSIIDTISISSTDIKFSHDEFSAFILGGKMLYVVDVVGKKIESRLSLNYQPLNIYISTDTIGYILGSDYQVEMKDLAKPLRNGFISYEENYKKFVLEQQERNKKIVDTLEIKDSKFGSIWLAVAEAVGEMVSEIGKPYDVLADEVCSSVRNYEAMMLSVCRGIKDTTNPTKKIFHTFNFKFTKDKVILNMNDANDKSVFYEYQYEDPATIEEIKARIKTYFKVRIDMLR